MKEVRFRSDKKVSFLMCSNPKNLSILDIVEMSFYAKEKKKYLLAINNNSKIIFAIASRSYILSNIIYLI